MTASVPPPASRNEQEAFERLVSLAQEYETRFGRPVPHPAMVSDSAVLKEVLKALKRGRPISDEHDWYHYLPPGADA